MLTLPRKNSLSKGILLYRRALRHKGYGVHSPFVYNLITKIIEERCPYYCFDDIELLRKRLRFEPKPVPGIVAHEAIHPKQGALLFRLTHYFRAQNILQIGAAMGLSTLYMTSYRAGVNCITLEKRQQHAAIARWVYEKAARTPIDLRVGDYAELLPLALKGMDSMDFVFFNTRREPAAKEMFELCAQLAHDDTVFVFEGIKTSNIMRNIWISVCKHPKVTVTIDLYTLGVVLFNRKLHKRNYTVYF
jgi:predicted O-methyltransferase YrrM